jgi:tRNA A-37 threonylcarbamoyl transferase component Bud32
MLKINLSPLRNKIDSYVKEYYSLSEKPELKEIDKDKQWITAMISKFVDFSIIEIELKDLKSINIAEIAKDYEDDTPAKKCISKKGFEIEKSLSHNKYILKNGKAAKIVLISMWQYSQKNEMKSVIENEFNISKKAEALGIGPKTYDTFICMNTTENRAYKVVVTEFIKGTSLAEWLKKDHSKEEKKNIHTILKKKLNKMHEHGIIHNSMNAENVILKFAQSSKTKISDLFITDYNHAYDVQDKKMWDYNQWIQSDRQILDNIMNKIDSYSNSDDVLLYVSAKLIDNKDIIIT